MASQDELNYARIEKAIHYIRENLRNRPSLAEVADFVHLSEFHFQRIFTKWAGVSPKKFSQFLSLEYAKSVLESNHSPLDDVAYSAGLSGTSRLHDLFVNIEGMTPGTYKAKGKNLNMKYSFFNSKFGKIIIASTHIGICHLHFIDNEKSGLKDLQARFPFAEIQQKADDFHKSALAIFNKDWSNLPEIRLHLAGTPFQIKVWESLLRIPTGALSTYKRVANDIDNPNAMRAVGSAIGSNPIAFLIPCHRVIKSDGSFGKYMWGEKRKMSLIGWEAALGEG